MKEINYKSDFTLSVALHDAAGASVPFPEDDWEAEFWASSRAVTYRASHIGGKYVKCIPDESNSGAVIFIFDNHRLGQGILRVELHTRRPDGRFGDGVQDLYAPSELGVRLVSGSGEESAKAEAEALLPTLKGEKGDKGDKGEQGDKGDAFTYADFTHEEISELQRPATEAAASLKALEQEVSEAEERRTAAEATRVEEFAGFESKIDSKQDALATTEDLKISADNELSLTDMAKKRLFIDMWDKAWGTDGKYDPGNAPDAEHPFMGNGVWMTYEEALTVYAGRCEPLDELSGHWRHYQGRTTLSERNPPYATSYNMDRVANNSKIEVLRLCGGIGMIWCTSAVHLCCNCYELREIYPIIRDETKAPQYFYDNWLAAFANCPKLELVKIWGIKYNISFTTSPKLKSEVFRYLVDNAANTSAITVTVHPDVYAKLTGDTANPAVAVLSAEELAAWQQIVTDAVAKSISFATA